MSPYTKSGIKRKSPNKLLVIAILLLQQVLCIDLPEWVPETNPITLDFGGSINETEPIYEYIEYATQQYVLVWNINRLYTDGTYMSGIRVKW